LKLFDRLQRLVLDVVCPSCGGEGLRVISGGFPGKFCEACSTGWGLAFDLHHYLGWPFTGWMVPYNWPWDYFRALWRWLSCPIEGGGDDC